VKQHIWIAASVAATSIAMAPPASALIVNIDATSNGEQQGGADCAYQSCEGALIDPVQVTFAAGTYTLNDAYSPATGLEAGALYDAWNFEAGNGDAWAWHWKALLDDGADGATINTSNYAAHLLLDIDPLFVQDSFTTEAAAAAFGAATPPSTLTFSAPTTVDFVVNDYYLPDNAGGVSLDIEPVGGAPAPVPEPASWAMMIVGVGGLGAALRRRRPLAPA
jgi:hypothetical protein